MVDLPHNMLITYSGFFLVAVVISCLINGLGLKFASWGPRNKVKKIIRWQSTTKPAFGGISFYVLFITSLGAFTMLSGVEVVTENKQLIGLVAASSLAFLMGFADDAYNTIPILKFSMQISCGLILIYSGIYIDIFESPGLNYAITMFWIVGITNAMNLLDNMDAISSVVSIFIILSAMLIIYLNNDLSSVYFVLLIGVLSAILGFLYFNWHPSKIYMGDGGSQFLGLFLGAIGILYFWNLPETLNGHANAIATDNADLLSTLKNVIVTLLVFILPIVDTTTVFINRLSQGTSPFIGGRDHTTHHLFYLGLSDRKVAILFMCISTVSLLLVGIIVQYIDQWDYSYLFLFAAYIILVFSLLFYTTKVALPEVNDKETE
jgi:UDP-GlcNAc:undecaprenyl-phosphate GlcNAc-1-phosphate transferase